MPGFSSYFRPLVKPAGQIIFLLGCILSFDLYSQVTVNNPKVEQILLGAYNPNDYKPSNHIEAKDQVINILQQELSADTLKAYLEKLETFGNRNTGSDTISSIRGIGATRRWVRKKFLEYSSQNEDRLIVSYLNFVENICGMSEHRNVLGVLPGLDTSRKDVLVIEGHMDSRCEGRCDTSCYAPGMDDNGSGTALVMEITRVLSQFAFDRTIIFTTVTGEEQGLNGGEAMAIYLDNLDIEVLACLNNDVVGGVECGPKSSPPKCEPIGAIDSMNLRVFSWSPANDTSFISIHKQLARYLKLQQIEEVNPVTGYNINLRLQIREDRQGRGGDHIPFRQRQMRAIRFTSANEHGDGSGTSPDRQHTTTDVLGYDLSNPPDGILDTFLVDFNYLRRNAMTNAVNLSLIANSPPIPVPVYHRTEFGNIYAIEFEGIDSLYDHRIGVRKNNSPSLYFDTVLTFNKNYIDFWEITPSGNVSLHPMNYDGVYESIPTTHEDEMYLSTDDMEEVKCHEFFPNPVQSGLSFRWNCNLSIDQIDVYIYNMNGQLIKESLNIKFEREESQILDMSDLNPGLYQVMTVLNEDEKYVESIIKK